jgi:hypothetical protein
VIGVMLSSMTALTTPAAASPSGTIILTGGSSGTPTDLQLIGASSGYVLYYRGSQYPAMPTTAPVSGGTPVALSISPYDSAFSIAGSLVTAIGYDDATDVDSLDYEKADGTGAGSVDLPAGYHTSRFRAGSPTGRYVWSRNADGTIEISNLGTNGAVTNLVALPDSANTVIKLAVSDASGLLVAYRSAACDALAENIAFVPAAGGSVTTLFHPSSCATQYAVNLTIGGGEAAWESYGSSNETRSFKYVATSGGTVNDIGDPTFDYDAEVLAVTSAQLAFLGDNDRLFTYPLAGGGPTMSSYQTDEFSELVSTGSSIAFDELGTVSTAGIYTTPSAGAAPTKIVSDSVDPLAASDIALAPGRVGYEDNATPSAPIFTRSLTRSGDTLSAGPESLLASSATGYGLSLSGTRAAYLADGSTLDLQSAGGGVKTVASSSTDPNYGPNGAETSILSGRRVLYRSYDTSSGYALYDDLTGISTPISSSSQYGAATLWGNYLVWADTDGRIWRKDLSTDDTELIYTITHAANQDVEIDQVDAWGNTVAWSASVCPVQGGDCPSLPDGYITVAPGAMPGVPTPVNGGAPVLSNGYLAYINGTSTESPLVAQALSGGSPITVTSTPCFGPSRYSLDNSTIAWLDCQGIPGFPVDGTAEAAPLPHVANPPWFLGDAQAPVIYNPTTGSWNADLVTSAALTNCDVVISQASTTVRALPCATASMAFGEANTSWDGRDSGGNPVPNGLYTWTLVASNADGSLLDYNGSTTPVSGPVVVFGQSNPTPPTGNPTPTPTPTPTSTATPSPSAPGAPGGVLASPGDGEASVTWTPPADNGGSPITSYTVEDSTDGTIWHSATATAHATASSAADPATSQTVTGLTNGTSYVFRVAAGNASGIGAYSVASNPVTPTGDLRPGHLSIRAPLEIRAGNHALLATTLTDAAVGDPIANATVQLFRRTSNSSAWQLVHATTTNADGAASIDVKPLSNASYEWRYDGDATTGATTSVSRSVAVGQLVTIGVNSRRIGSGGTLKIYGSVNPAASGQVVQLQQRKHGRWASTGMHARISRRALPDGTRKLGYLIVVTMQQPGTYQIRVHRAATSKNAGGSSRVVTVRFT